MTKPKSDPLTWNVKIVDPETGFPTNEFLRQFNVSREFDGQVVDLFGITFIAGTGLIGGGVLGDLDDITFDLNVEFVQDLVGAMLTDSADLDWSYNDPAGTSSAVLTTTGVAANTYGDASHYPVLTIDAKGRVTAASVQAVSTSGVGDWTQAAIWDHAISGDTASPIPFTGLAGATEIMIVARNITKSVSQATVIQVSADNGATYRTTSGDYVTSSGGGAESNSTSIALLTASTGVRTGMAHIMTAKLNPQQVVGGNDNRHQVVAAIGAINALQVASAGAANFTGGTIRIYIR